MNTKIKKQSLGGFHHKSCCEKVLKTHRKKPVPASLFKQSCSPVENLTSFQRRFSWVFL